MKKPQTSSELNSSMRNISQSPSTFELYAVVVHIGSLRGGHYICYAKNSIDGEWYEFDDSKVTLKSEDKIAELEAYLLVYRKKQPMSNPSPNVPISSTSISLSPPFSNLSKEDEIEEVSSIWASALNSTTSTSSSASSSSSSCISPVYISKFWIYRWRYLFQHPGDVGIDELLCQHSKIDFSQFPSPNSMVESVPIPVYDLLAKRYGYGIVTYVDKLEPCQECEVFILI